MKLIPVLTPEIFSYDGLEVFNSELNKINKGFGTDILFHKVVINCLNRSFRRHDVYYEQMQKWNYDFYTIPQDAKIPESQIYNQSVFEYSPKSKSIPELRRLTNDILRRL